MRIVKNFKLYNFSFRKFYFLFHSVPQSTLLFPFISTSTSSSLGAISAIQWWNWKELELNRDQVPLPDQIKIVEKSIAHFWAFTLLKFVCFHPMMELKGTGNWKKIKFQCRNKNERLSPPKGIKMPNSSSNTFIHFY